MVGRDKSSVGTRRVTLLLLLVLLAGMAVRYWYLDWSLNSGRFWDEQFSFNNVLQLRLTGSLKPNNGYYPLLSYLPQALLLSASDGLHRLTGAGWLEVHDGDRFTPHAYRLARLVQAIWGVAAVWLVFLIGRRMFSTSVGLVAAAALAFAPWHIHASAVFKPDAPLVLATLAAFYWSLAAAARPSAGSYALAGGGVALAMSTKLTGGLAALPLVIVSALRCRREPRRLLLLALAGAVAVALFLLLNPYWPVYFEFLERLSQEYEWKAGVRGLSRWQAPILIAEFLRQSLGVLGIAAAVLATSVLVARLVRRRLDSTAAAELTMLLTFPPIYAAAYIAKTVQFKSNNFLPILPFVALAAAWGLVEAGRRLARRAPLRNGHPLLLAAGLTVVALGFVPRGLAYVHRTLTPSAEDLALRYVGRRLHEHPNCQIVYERGAGGWPPWEHAGTFDACRLRPVDRLADLDAAQLRLTDGVVFPQKRLAGDTAGFYLQAIAASEEGQTAVFRRRRGRSRGPGFVAAMHPWKQIAPPQDLVLHGRDEGRFRLQATMPEAVAAGDVVSFTVWMPSWALAEGQPPPQLRMGRHIVDLLPVRSKPQGTVFISPRLVSRQPAPHARLNRHQPSSKGSEVRLTLWRWRP